MARTLKAVRECAKWLVACLSFGWRKQDLDLLESLWWKYHNNQGALKSAISRKESPRG